VYPESQSGSSGMAMRAGATGQNLTESQFGIASVKFRWNLSGSYQQVIPRYFSTNNDNKDEKEFLNEYFPDAASLAKAIFLKGYQWPFDPRKIKDHGSSLIDLLVYRETEEKSRKVFVDFRRNMSFGGNENFSLESLDREVYNYLDRSGAIRSTPYERLIAINPQAADLYKTKGIDLNTDPLEIAICVQHNNGGLKGDIWWESDLENLFPVGEVNGSHGVYRPGGSALNSGQVGSYRAALHILKKHNFSPPKNKDFLQNCKSQIESELENASGWLKKGNNENGQNYLDEIRKRMSSTAGIIRNAVKIRAAVTETSKIFEHLKDNIGASDVNGLLECFMLSDQCLTSLMYLKAIDIYLENGGRSRGSYLVTDHDQSMDDPARFSPLMCEYDKQAENEILEIKYTKGILKSSFTSVRPVPVQDLWFEKIWAVFLKDNYPGS
jgi:succinate dehydrogenase/fumarate reductase flavoprotein subunit